jgi:hypothetical protein
MLPGGPFGGGQFLNLERDRRPLPEVCQYPGCVEAQPGRQGLRRPRRPGGEELELHRYTVLGYVLPQGHVAHRLRIGQVLTDGVNDLLRAPSRVDGLAGVIECLLSA